MQDHIIKALRLIIKHYYTIERTHWEEGGAKDNDHIFHALNDVYNHLKTHDEIEQKNQRERVDRAMDMYKDMVGIIANETHEQMAERVFKQRDLSIQNDNGLTDEDELRADLNEEDD